MSEKDSEVKCPICDYKPRDSPIDNPDTAKIRLHGHLFLKHGKGELIHAILILLGYEKKNDSELWKAPL